MKAQPEKVFRFRLARELGMTVEQLLREMDSREYIEWMAFFAIDNEEREQQRKQRQGSDKKSVAKRLQATMKGWAGGSKGR